MKIFVESTNLAPDEFYNEIELLGQMFNLAAADFKHIHLVTFGHNFNDSHSMMDSYNEKCLGYMDSCFELCMESGVIPRNTAKSLEYVDSWEPAEKDSYDYQVAFQTSENILTNLVNKIKEIRSIENIPTDIQSLLDEWLRDLTREINYFIRRRTV